MWVAILQVQSVKANFQFAKKYLDYIRNKLNNEVHALSGNTDSEIILAETQEPSRLTAGLSYHKKKPVWT